MKYLPLTVVIFSVACASTTSSTSGEVESPAPEVTSDIAAAKPGLVDVLFTVDYVRMLEFTLPPGAELTAHEGKRRLVYSLSDYVLEWREGEGPVEEKAWSTGDVHVHASLAHRARNVGETTARFLVVERLDSPLPEAPSVEGGPEVVFSDEVFRVRKVRLEPGASVDAHAGTYRAIYSLSDYELLWSQNKAATETVSWKAGDAHWHEPDEHAMSNAGDSPAEWLVFEILQ